MRDLWARRQMRTDQNDRLLCRAVVNQMFSSLLGSQRPAGVYLLVDFGGSFELRVAVRVDICSVSVWVRRPAHLISAARLGVIKRTIYEQGLSTGLLGLVWLF